MNVDMSVLYLVKYIYIERDTTIRNKCELKIDPEVVFQSMRGARALNKQE